MTARAHRRRLASLTLVLALLLGAASAQTRERTGTVDVVLGGEARTFHTHVQKVPENAAEGVENPDVRRMLERLAGTSQHTATWMAMEPIVMAGIVLYAAEELFITIGATVPMDRPGDVGEISLEFALSKATLALDDSEDASIDFRFFPVSWGFDAYYAASEGMFELVIDEVEQVDETTLRIRGSFRGTLSFQTAYQIEYNADDTMSVTGTFDIEQVGGSSVLELLLDD
jgi:hypothetical protein